MNNDRTRVVVLGGGFAGAYCVKQLEKSVRGQNVEITLVNEQNYFVFTPMLIEAATSALEPRHVLVPLRGFLKSSRLVMARTAAIDIEGKTVTTQPEFGDPVVLPFDHVILALGSITKMPATPGVREYAFGLKSLADATALRDRAIGMLEMASLAPDHDHRQGWLTFAVVGAGYTGVEAAGEFNAFLKEAVGNYPNVSETDIHVMLLQRSGRILDALDDAMSEKASAILRQNGVDIRLNESVSKISQTSFTLKSGQEIASHTVIWSAGVAPSPLLKEANLPTNSHGYLKCEKDFRVTGHDNVWGIGDCASNLDPQGDPYPPTAQHALREGRQAARNLAAVLKGRPTEALDYHTKGTMAPLGGRQAIANIFGMHLTGIVAWFLWRTVYLGIMPGVGRKIRVAMDWTADLFFRRDYAQQNTPSQRGNARDDQA